MGIFSSVLVSVSFIDAMAYSKSHIGVHSCHAIVFHQFGLEKIICMVKKSLVCIIFILVIKKY